MTILHWSPERHPLAVGTQKGKRRASKYHRWNQKRYSEMDLVMQAPGWEEAYMRVVKQRGGPWLTSAKWESYYICPPRDTLRFRRVGWRNVTPVYGSHKLFCVYGKVEATGGSASAHIFISFTGTERQLTRMIKRGKFNFLRAEVYRWASVSSTSYLNTWP